MKKKILAAVMAATMVFSLQHAAPLMQAATQQPVQVQQPEQTSKCKRRNYKLQILRRSDQSRYHQ